jgi:hypothetical protein
MLCDQALNGITSKVVDAKVDRHGDRVVRPNGGRSTAEFAERGAGPLKTQPLHDSIDLAMTLLDQIHVATQRLLHYGSLAEMRHVMLELLQGLGFGLEHDGPIRSHVINHDTTVAEAIVVLHG